MNIKENLWVIVIGALVVGAVFGYIIAGVSKTTASEPKNIAFSSKATDLRVNMNALLREHAAVGGVMLVDLYDGKNVSAKEKLMMANADQVTALVTTVYGVDSGKKFSDLWMKHMDEYKNYTMAVANGDQAGQDSAKENLNKIGADLGKLLGSASIPADQVTSLIGEHVSGTLAIIDAHAAGDGEKEATLMKAGYDQAGKMADRLSEGIINDHQDMFK